uniref:CCHC-type domain-containing protein n=1 Tax=Bracon brevicornis TaxID=1563983 RepID=A0A6V7LZT1_9HYME
MFAVPNGDHVRRWKETFELLGQQVSNLTRLVNEKKNIGGKIQAAAEAAEETFERLRKLDEKVTVVSPHRESVGAQTTPSLMRRRAEPITPQGPEEAEYTKRKLVTPPLAGTRKVKKAKRRTKKSTGKVEKDVSAMEVVDTPEEAREDEEWQEVVPRKKTQERSQLARRERPSALILKPNGSATYADIVSKVKKVAALTQVGEAVKEVRKTKDGNVLLILKKNAEDKVAEYSSAISDALADEAAVTSGKAQQVLLEVTKLDSTVSKEEIFEALQTSLGEGNEIQPEAVVSIRMAFGGTSKVLLKLPLRIGKVLLGKQTIRVGWSNGRVREALEPLKCFKCWDYGHIGSKCTSEVDRSKLCMKCCKAGHKAADCSAQHPHCILCQANGKKETQHMQGTKNCPVFLKAQRALAQKGR